MELRFLIYVMLEMPKLVKEQISEPVQYLRFMMEKIFFFKQKTAYEFMPSIVGSEMCIRDRIHPALRQGKTAKIPVSARFPAAKNHMVEFPINYSGQVEMKAHRADLQIFYTANPPIPVRKKHDNCKTLE